MTNERSINVKLIVRTSRNKLAFAVVNTANAEQPVSYCPYDVKNGITMAANLREAFRTVPLLQDSYQRVVVAVDAPVLMVPVDLYQEQERETLYYHSFPQSKQDIVLSYVLPNLNCVVLYAINRDLRLVLNDHFPQAQYICSSAPIWRYLHQRSFTGVRAKLFGYFHDQYLEVFSFQQNRFKFHNSFETTRTPDTVFYLLYVWKQFNLQQEHDELHLAGEIPEQTVLLEELRKYLKRAYVVNPAADFNRSPVTQIADMPYDLMTLIVKGR